MADKKISQLTNITGANLADTDEFVVVDSSADETKAITWSELKEGLDTGTGFVRITGDTMTGDLSFGDNDKAIFGAGSDLQIYHDGSHSWIKDVGTGDLTVSGDNLYLEKGDGTKFLYGVSSTGQVRLYYGDAQKFITTSTGIDVTGQLVADSGQFDGNVNIDGTVTADGLTVDGDISATGGDVDLDTLDLNAIAESKAVTAVDVFVYDTSKDSDGGAWRKRTQGTSWYNETLNTATRGSRREFPAVAVIVAESSKVTIYDGDDPSLPMWMVFNQASGGFVYNTATSIFAVNGLFCCGTLTTIGQCDFVSDSYFFRNSNGTKWNTNDVLNRNKTGGPYSTGLIPPIVSSSCNDVAMTVLPNAPIDPATGLQVPTIAVATAGGVSVIKDDGNVWDITGTNWGNTSSGVIFDRGTLYFMQAIYYWLACEVAGLSQDHALPDGYNSLNDNYPFKRVTLTESIAYRDAKRKVATGGETFDLAHHASHAYPYDRLVQHKRGVAGGPNLFNYTTSTYNTGWMNGDIKGAFLSDTDDTDLVGGNLVTNGTFDTDTDWTKGIDWTISGGVATHTVGTGSDLNQANVLTIGNRYLISFDVTAVTDFGTIYVYSNLGYEVIAGAASVGSYTYEFTAGTTDLRFRGASTFGGSVDNISVKLADADRSVNNNGLIVNGTVTRTPVATGAELVAYSGFTTSNYLEQPYNSALDFGTGDFCVMGWVKVASDTWGMIVDRYTGSSGRFSLGYTPSGSSAVAEFNINAYRHQGTTLLGSTWRHVTLVRSSGVASLYVDGVLDASFSRTEDVTSNTSAPLIIGKRYDNVQQADQGALLALLRISATAPTAEQIKKIYEDEKVLFQENAQATLYGTSDAVTALAHDSDTDLLHVGTSAGRSVFQGLRRVSNTTTAVGTAISASNGLVVEE